MATSTFRNKNKIRPKKRGAKKRRRLLEQKRRVLALGVSDDAVRKMTMKEIRTLLQRPLALKQSE